MRERREIAALFGFRRQPFRLLLRCRVVRSFLGGDQDVSCASPLGRLEALLVLLVVVLEPILRHGDAALRARPRQLQILKVNALGPHELRLVILIPLLDLLFGHYRRCSELACGNERVVDFSLLFLKRVAMRQFMRRHERRIDDPVLQLLAGASVFSSASNCVSLMPLERISAL